MSESEIFELDSIPYIWIDSDSKLDQCVARWKSESYLIVDTEFERSTTYYAKAGLIQVAAAGKTYLLDPFSFSSLKPLALVLEDPDIEIVLHSMSEDIDLLSHLCECTITSVFDSQIAAAFLGLGLSVGYQRLVEMVLDISLDKGETRSDWLRRPLSKKQLHYAAADVFYLEEIYKQLRQKLEISGWLAAVLEDCNRQVSAIENSASDPKLAYLKLRGAWDLPIDRQVILSRLTAWRDIKAVEENIPKSWVFSDAQLIEIARILPESHGPLYKLPKAKPKSVRRFGDELLSQLEMTKLELLGESGAEQLASIVSGFTLVERPIKGKELEFYKKIKKMVAIQAGEVEIDPQLIAGRKLMEAWVISLYRDRDCTLPESVLGWREPLIGEQLLALASDLPR